MHKTYENYCISRIIQELYNLEIKFITQQMFKRQDGNIALADLYFPQINLYVEIDENYHKKKLTDDKKRTKEIQETNQLIRKKLKNLDEIITEDLEEVRIDVSESIDIENINKQIDSVVENM